MTHQCDFSNIRIVVNDSLSERRSHSSVGKYPISLCCSFQQIKNKVTEFLS